MIKIPIVHLTSGGMDSIVGLYDHVGEGELVHSLIVDYGQSHRREIECAKYHCDRLRVLFTVIKIPPLRGSILTDGQGTVIVPNRNSILLSLAVNLACSIGAELVTFSANKGDAENFPDCRPEFVAAFNEMLKSAEISVQVCAPYIECSKAWIARRGSDIGVELDRTWSCYRGGLTPCGECEACKKREEVLT